MPNFIEKYFLEPIINNQGYNIVNTTIYAITAVTVIYFFFKILKRFNFKFDKKFLLVSTIFAVFGAVFHTLSDTGVLPRNFFTVSPGIWLVVSLPVFFVLIISKILFNVNYYKASAIIGAILGLASLYFYRIVDYRAVALVVLTNAFVIAVSLIALAKLKAYKNPLWKYAVSAQLFDGATTFTTLYFYPNYFEQHVLGNFFINIFGPFGIVIMKLFVVLPIIYLIERDEKDKETENYLFIIITLLGLLPGLRDALRLFAGV